MGKFGTHSDEGIFLGYSFSSKAYKVFNKRTRKVMETVNVMVNETSTPTTLEEFNQLPKSTPPLAPESDKIVEEPSPPSTPSVAQPSNNTSIEVTPDPVTPPLPIGLVEREPSSRVKLNHPPNPKKEDS